MTEKINDLSVWQGSELPQREDWLVEISDEEVVEIDQAVASVADIDIEAIHPASIDLPRLGQTLAGIQQSLEHGSGATLVRGYPFHRLDRNVAAKIFLGLSQFIGTPISQSATGEKVFHVKDAGFQDNDPRARGPNTKKKLSFHTDRCDVIGFMCLRQAKSGGENFLVSSTAIYNRIAEQHPDLLENLMRPFFYQRHNVDQGNELAYCRQPVFSFCEGRFACSFLRVLIDRAYASGDVPPMTDQQLAALDLLEKTAEDPQFQHRFFQQPGDMLFLNNWTTLHRRTEFVDHDEPERKRHLLRIWLSVPNSRPISPLFKDNFGATEAGAIRGGMRAVS
jgi:hypothetical protein